MMRSVSSQASVCQLRAWFTRTPFFKLYFGAPMLISLQMRAWFVIGLCDNEFLFSFVYIAGSATATRFYNYVGVSISPVTDQAMTIYNRVVAVSNSSSDFSSVSFCPPFFSFLFLGYQNLPWQDLWCDSLGLFLSSDKGKASLRPPHYTMQCHGCTPLHVVSRMLRFPYDRNFQWSGLVPSA